MAPILERHVPTGRRRRAAEEDDVLAAQPVVAEGVGGIILFGSDASPDLPADLGLRPWKGADPRGGMGCSRIPGFDSWGSALAGE